MTRRGMRDFALFALMVSLLAVCLPSIAPSAMAVGTWSPPIQLSAAGRNGIATEMSASADGNVLAAVWRRYNGSVEIVQASTSTDAGSTWSTPVDLSTDGANAGECLIRVSADGSTMAATWLRYGTGTAVVQVTMSHDFGATWSAPRSLTAPGAYAYYPQLTLSADGSRVALFWSTSDGSIQRIQTASSADSGATWSATQSISSAGLNSRRPCVSTSSDGTRISAVWERWNYPNWVIATSSSQDAGTSWSVPTDLSAAGQAASACDVAVSSDGSVAVATWERSNGTNTIIQTAASSNAGVTWSAPTDLSAVGGNAGYSQVAVTPDGVKRAIVWRRSDGAVGVAQVSISANSGATWSTPADISTAGKSVATVFVAMSTDGNQIMMAWSELYNTVTYVARTRASDDSGATWSAATTVSSSSPIRDGNVMNVAMSQDGSVRAIAFYGPSVAGGYYAAQVATLVTGTAGLTPALGAITRTATGFTVPITNPDAAYTWSAASTSGSASISGNTVSVTGLAAGASATVTITTTRSGYRPASARATGQALSGQTLTWAPTTAITLPASPLTPSTLATALGGAAITYAVVSAGTTGCSVDSSSALLTYSAEGSCTVRATAAATSSYASGTQDVTFTISLATQTVTWTPTTAVTLPASPLTPSNLASALGAAPITYAVTSAGSTGCTVNSITAVLTYTAAGSCTVRATAAATSGYASGSTQVTFVVSNAGAGLTWSPSTSLVATSGSAVFAAASAASPGVISYAVTSAGSTGCSVDSNTRTLTFSAAGSCQVTASVAATSGYDAGSSVSTFAIALDTPNLSWSPTLNVGAASSPFTFASATSDSGGAITYAVTSSSGAGCNISDSTQPVLSVNTSGTCSITAQVAQTGTYAARTSTQTFTIALTVPSFTWTPTTSLTMPASTVSPAQAVTNSSGTVTYAVTSDSGTGCSVNPTSGAVSYTATGQCEITSILAATSRFAGASLARTFMVSLVQQTLIASASPSTLAPGATSTLSHTGAVGSGTITWSLASASGSCTLTGTTLTAVADGSCTSTVSITADATYAGSSSSVVVTVATPSAGPSNDSAAQATSSHGFTPSPSSPGADVAAAVTPITDAVPTVGRSLPPDPVKVTVTRSRLSSQAQVGVTLPQGSAGTLVRFIVAEVLDSSGHVVARVTVSANSGQSAPVLSVPLARRGYRVAVYTANEVGVSLGAPARAPMSHRPTISRRTPDRTPILFGSPVGSPIIFNAGPAVLDAGDKSRLDRIARTANSTNARLFITGFARLGGGTQDERMAISTQRARVVAAYLAARGVRVWMRYWGAGALLGSGGASDRRVEIRQSTSVVPRNLVP